MENTNYVCIILNMKHIFSLHFIQNEKIHFSWMTEFYNWTLEDLLKNESHQSIFKPVVTISS